MPEGEDRKLVTVLMAAYNGERYIREQIDSILAQEGVRIRLIVRDDGSTDCTQKILREYESRGKCVVYAGENAGPAANFFMLMGLAGPSDYYAWSDQDDVWDADKLRTAVALLDGIENRYRLYWCNHRTLTESGVHACVPDRKPALTFGSALMGSYAQGATMVFSRELLDLARERVPDFRTAGIWHDAWLHKACLAAGGSVVYDPVPHLTRRIHGGNVAAKKETKRASFAQRVLRRLLPDDPPGYYSGMASLLLKHYGDVMPEKNRTTARRLAEYRTHPGYRLGLFFSPDYRCGSTRKKIGFLIACIINRA